MWQRTRHKLKISKENNVYIVHIKPVKHCANVKPISYGRIRQNEIMEQSECIVNKIEHHSIKTTRLLIKSPHVPGDVLRSSISKKLISVHCILCGRRLTNLLLKTHCITSSMSENLIQLVHNTFRLLIHITRQQCSLNLD